MSEEGASVEVSQGFGRIGLSMVYNDDFDNRGCELARLSSDAGDGAWYVYMRIIWSGGKEAGSRVSEEGIEMVSLLQ